MVRGSEAHRHVVWMASPETCMVPHLMAVAACSGQHAVSIFYDPTAIPRQISPACSTRRAVRAEVSTSSRQIESSSPFLPWQPPAHAAHEESSVLARGIELRRFMPRDLASNGVCICRFALQTHWPAHCHNQGTDQSCETRVCRMQLGCASCAHFAYGVRSRSDVRELSLMSCCARTTLASCRSPRQPLQHLQRTNGSRSIADYCSRLGKHEMLPFVWDHSASA